MSYGIQIELLNKFIWNSYLPLYSGGVGFQMELQSKNKLKVHGPIFQNLVFYFIWSIITPKMWISNFRWNGQAVWI